MIINLKLSLSRLLGLSGLYGLLGMSVFSLLVGGCASKQRSGPPDLYLPQGQTGSPVHPGAPEDPTAHLQTPPPFSAVESGEGPKHEVPRMALVLGGAGVSSFATVGLLKRFHEEGIKFDFVVATGWPALFSLGGSVMNSIHDVEWFAMRLQEKDLSSLASCTRNDDVGSGHISSLIENTFQGKNLSQANPPLTIAANNTDVGPQEVTDSGDWRAALVKTMAVPGIYRDYPDADAIGTVGTTMGIDVDEALRRGAKIVVAIEMYDDYLAHTRKEKKVEGDKAVRKLFISRLESGVAAQMSKATVTGRIVLGKEPDNLAAKRAAIVAGYKEGARIARQLRSLLSRAPLPHVDIFAKAE
jgi:hypothetical protein